MSVSLALKLATEFHRLLAEGWEPDLDEFLSRVPEQYRADCRQQIDLMAAPAAEPADAEPMPVAGEPAPAVEEPTPVAEEPAPAVDAPTPVAEDAPVEISQAAPEVEETTLAEDAPAELAAEEAPDASVLEGALEFSLFDDTEKGEDDRAEQDDEAASVDEPVPVAAEFAEETDEAFGADESPDEIEDIVEDIVENVAEAEDVADIAEVVDELDEVAEVVDELVEVDDDDEELEADEPPPPALLRVADELRSLAEELAHEAHAAVDECVSDLAEAVGVEDATTETEPSAEPEPEPVDPAASGDETVEFAHDAPAEPEEADAEPVAPKGPQRLSKAEAMAMWDSQLTRAG